MAHRTTWLRSDFAWSNLKRLLKQRNAALRQVTRYEQLRPWDKELIPLAEQISTWRAEYSAGIAADMADTCKQKSEAKRS